MRKYKRREFLKCLGLLGTGVLAGALASKMAEAYSIPQVEKIYSPESPLYPVDVIVFRDGEYAVAVDSKGKTIARSTDHAQVIQSAIEYGGKIVIRGDLHVNSSVKPSTTSEVVHLYHVVGTIYWNGENAYMIDLESAPAKKIVVEGLKVVGKGVNVSRQGLIRIGSPTNILEKIVIKGCDIRNILPEGGTSVMALVRAYAKMIVAEENYIEHVDPSLVPSDRLWDTFQFVGGAGTDEHSVVLVRKNHFKWYQDCVDTWGGLVVVEDNVFEDGAGDTMTAIDFARAMIAIARKNKVKSTHANPAIYYHLASGTLPAKMLIVENNYVELTVGDLSADGLVTVGAGEYVVIRNNRVIGGTRQINITTIDGEIDTLIIEGNKLENSRLLGISVYANQYNINKVFIINNDSHGASTSDIYVNTNIGNIGLLVETLNDADKYTITGSITEKIIKWNKGKEPELGEVGILTDCTNLPTSGYFKGHMVACYDTVNAKWVLKVWDGSSWQTIG